MLKSKETVCVRRRREVVRETKNSENSTFICTRRARRKKAKTLCQWLSPGNLWTRSAKFFREFCLSAGVDEEHNFERGSAKAV